MENSELVKQLTAGVATLTQRLEQTQNNALRAELAETLFRLVEQINYLRRKRAAALE